MTTARNHPPIPDATVRSVVKLGIVVAAIVFMIFLGRSIPGIDRLMGVAPISTAIVIRLVLALAIAGMLVTVAPLLARVGTLLVDGPPRLTEQLSSLFHWSIVLVPIIVAHRGIALAIDAVAPGWILVFDVVGLLIAVAPLSIVALPLYFSVDPVTDATIERLTAE